MEITDKTPIYFIECVDYNHDYENWTIVPHYLFLSEEAAQAWIDKYNDGQDKQIAQNYARYVRSFAHGAAAYDEQFALWVRARAALLDSGIPELQVPKMLQKPELNVHGDGNKPLSFDRWTRLQMSGSGRGEQYQVCSSIGNIVA